MNTLVNASNGVAGQGVSAATGMALGYKLKNAVQAAEDEQTQEESTVAYDETIKLNELEISEATKKFGSEFVINL